MLRLHSIWNRFQLNDYDLEGAACANPDFDPEWWTIENSRMLGARVHLNNRIAKRICSGCKVMAECLAAALDNPELLGVWGGTTEAERTV